MKNSYRLYRRKGIYYVHDAATRRLKLFRATVPLKDRHIVAANSIIKA
jgi:hypothetical protein